MLAAGSIKNHAPQKYANSIADIAVLYHWVKYMDWVKIQLKTGPSLYLHNTINLVKCKKGPKALTSPIKTNLFINYLFKLFP